MIVAGTLFVLGFWREGFEQFEILDLKWCILLHFGHKYIKAQICFIQPLWLGLDGTLFFDKRFSEILKI